MRFLGIIPKQVTHKLLVEDLRLIQKVCMPVSKLFLYRSVEAFQVTIGLGMARVVEVVHQVLFAASLGEMFFKFMAIISLHPCYPEGSHTS